MEKTFGILVGFGVVLVTALLFFTEHNTHLSGETSVVLFKRKKKALVARGDEERFDVVNDEEKHLPRGRSLSKKMRRTSSMEVAVPIVSDVFTWRHLKYDVRVRKGETRRLLEDVSGYVAPGKLTALMGESGAGKVSREFRRYKFTLKVLSSDYTLECPRRAPGGWRC